VTVKHTNRDAAIGAAAGAVIGATSSRNKVKGGVIGAAIGGIPRWRDRQQRRQDEEKAVTNRLSAFGGGWWDLYFSRPQPEASWPRKNRYNWKDKSLKYCRMRRSAFS
jgi:hypothetical protein